MLAMLAVQEVASVELHSGLGGVNLENTSALGIGSARRQHQSRSLQTLFR